METSAAAVAATAEARLADYPAETVRAALLDTAQMCEFVLEPGDDQAHLRELLGACLTTAKCLEAPDARTS